MKKIVIAMFLVLALTASAFAASFADVPSSHWAYEAVNKLVASGILSGYPDGTFKGQNNLSRYEIAVVVARVLDQIEAEQAALADGIADADSLSVGQAQQVNEIVKAIVAKNTGEELSDEQANEVRSIVQALTFEFRPELKEIGAAVDALAVDVDELDSRVSALEAQPRDNVSITGTVDTIFETADYGDDKWATAYVWADGDALDLDDPYAFDSNGNLIADDDSDDLPAEKAFYQEIGLNISANVSDINFDLALDGIKNLFSKTKGVFGELENEEEFKMDTGLLSISKDDYSIRAGDFEDYGVEPYFIDEEDMEGIEITAPLAGLDFKLIALGEDEDGVNNHDEDQDYYGVTVTNKWDRAKLTGKLYHARNGRDGVGEFGDELTDFAVAAEGNVTDDLILGGEVVFNDSDDESDTLFNLNASYLLTDVVTLRGEVETVGEDFMPVLDDLEEVPYEVNGVSGVIDNNYDKFNIGADFALNANNTLKADYTLFTSDYKAADEDKNEFEVGLENVTGKFTNNASITFTQNDDYVEDTDVTLLELGTEYAMSDIDTIAGKLVYKDADVEELNYVYLVGSIDHKLSDNLSWLNEVQLINGEVLDTDAEGSSFKSQLSFSF
ncbi:S-layer homology domain-containing protein [Halocella sp. SP3-1]|uniref:S-layer homology domain-containing protein n=1 Tax=Halocella sp. SP3-1 TaxID=2382161 RepID=UPI000F757F32|nr:S-layer homology domain-containing protein [Halocella sp. SP3-1]AZO94268.1 S-layer homology domain-containing protein [Halocella sp. SP3-1]